MCLLFCFIEFFCCFVLFLLSYFLSVVVVFSVLISFFVGFFSNSVVFCFVQKTFRDEELLPLQLVIKKLDLISELRER